MPPKKKLYKLRPLEKGKVKKEVISLKPCISNDSNKLSTNDNFQAKSIKEDSLRKAIETFDGNIIRIADYFECTRTEIVALIHKKGLVDFFNNTIKYLEEGTIIIAREINAQVLNEIKPKEITKNQTALLIHNLNVDEKRRDKTLTEKPKTLAELVEESRVNSEQFRQSDIESEA